MYSIRNSEILCKNTILEVSARLNSAARVYAFVVCFSTTCYSHNHLTLVLF